MNPATGGRGLAGAAPDASAHAAAAGPARASNGRKPVRLAPAFALAVLALLAAGCTDTPDKVPQENGVHVVHLLPENKFSPAKGSVPAGANLTFVNDGGLHDVAIHQNDKYIAGSEAQPPVGYGVGHKLGPGDRWSISTLPPGKYDVWCHMHHEERMYMELVVT